jgi:hypothetical protein
VAVVAVQTTHPQQERVRLVVVMVVLTLGRAAMLLLTQALAVVLVAVVLHQAEMVALVL